MKLASCGRSRRSVLEKRSDAARAGKPVDSTPSQENQFSQVDIGAYCSSPSSARLLFKVADRGRLGNFIEAAGLSMNDHDYAHDDRA